MVLVEVYEFDVKGMLGIGIEFGGKIDVQVRKFGDLETSRNHVIESFRGQLNNLEVSKGVKKFNDWK